MAAAIAPQPPIAPRFVPPVIGHRGAAAVAPENTLAGLVAAAAAGVRWAEVDVALTGDGVPVLLHDDTLDRTTDGTGPLARTPFTALRRQDAGAWFAAGFVGERVPRLIDALRVADETGLGLNLEIKPTPGTDVATANGVLAALAGEGGADPAGVPVRPLLLSSFSDLALKTAAQVAPGWPRGLLIAADAGGGADIWCARAIALGCTTVHLPAERADGPAFAAAQAAGLDVLVYTVNDGVAAERLLSAGAAAIITDDPAAMLACLTRSAEDGR